ncbi:phospholipase D-like domain-containing protein [Jatrophihabitans sp.]|uniref:phospholipase D-like domain-containing protein n=1 Tax=Jatrophihabitans sp. TaxID=1932789 RepID=UPI002C57D3CD|nr:phospholipase D-like domain-containing protein [Jatrophihabitans sp.]
MRHVRMGFLAASLTAVLTGGLVAVQPTVGAVSAVSALGTVSPNCNTVAPQSVTATVASAQVEATFNDPVAHGGQDLAQLNEIIRLVNCTPGGATIRMAIYSITANTVYRAIADAVARGVLVQVVHNGEDKNSSDSSPTDLAALLGANHHWCDHGSAGLAYGGGCLSNDPSSLMHAKYLLFSQTQDLAGVMQSNVTWFGSPNETFASGANLFNNSVTVYGDATLYDDFINYVWTPMWQENSYPGNDFYDVSTPRGYFSSGYSGVTGYVSPQQQTDLVVDRLSYVNPNSSCQLRVMEATIHDTRSAVVTQLASLHKGGCKVYVTVGSIDPGVLKTLVSNGIAVHSAPVHDKLIIFYGSYADVTTNRYTIFTGSHNLTKSALSINDELLVKIQGVPQVLYQAFYSHFGDAYSTGTVCTATSCPAQGGGE